MQQRCLSMPTVPMHIALLGGINMDVSVYAHHALRGGDSNPGRVQCSPGGVARNVAENLLRLGQDARLLGVLGDDVFGQALWQSGAAMGLDMRACLTLPAQRSATYVCLHQADGDMDVAVNDMDIMDALTPTLLQPQLALLRSAAVLVADCNLRPDVWQWLAAEVAHPALFAEAVSVAKCARLGPVLPRIHTLKANRLEAQALCSRAIDSVQEACDAALALHRQGVGRVLISLGAQGVAWCDADGRCGHRAARAVPVLSATGAGDALMGGLVYGHLQGWPLEAALAWAMACAEITLGSPAANAPTLTVQAVQNYLQHT
jgi:pseudouridine kinase